MGPSMGVFCNNPLRQNFAAAAWKPIADQVWRKSIAFWTWRKLSGSQSNQDRIAI